MPDESGVSSPPQNHVAASLLALAGWSYLLDRILAGVCHDLNGRVSSLQAVTQLIELGEPLPATLRAEPGKLEDIVQFLSLIPAFLSADPIPIPVEELLSRAVDLHAKVRGAMAEPVPIEVRGDVPPVLVNEGRAVRGMVLLLHHSATSSPDTTRAVMVYREREGAVLALPVGVAGIQDPDALGPLAQLFEMDGGELEAADGELVLRLPSLASARAQGR